MATTSFLGWYSDTGATAAITTTTPYTEIYAKLTFDKADVRAVYIDWDDGTSNKQNEANYQWVQSTEPLSTYIVPHTYTKSGSFKPVVQVVNSDGIVSNYLSNEATNTDVAPHEYRTTVSGMTVTDSAATGILRVENKQVLSGIDNSIFDKYGPRDIYFAVAPVVSQADAVGLLDAPEIEIEAEVVNLNDADAAGTYLGGSIDMKTISFTGSTTLDAGQNVEKINSNSYRIRRITKVTYKSSKISKAQTYTATQNFNKLKLFILTTGNNTLTAGGSSLTPYYPVTYITNGSPVKRADDEKRVVNLDMSQSRAAASNATISNYYYANGKNWFTPVDEWAGTTTLTSVSGGTDAVHAVSYTYQPRPDGLLQKGTTTDASAEYVLAFGASNNLKWYTATDQQPRQDQFIIDDYNRFVPQGHLLRTYVKASSTSGSSLDNYTGIFRVSPALNWVNSGSQVAVGNVSQSITKLYENEGASAPTHTVDITTNATTNTQSGIMDLDAVNKLAYKSRTNADRDANEYLLLLASKKHNKVFFQCTPQAQELMSNASGGTNQIEIGGLYYLHADKKDAIDSNIYWKPLRFQDGTKSTIEYRNTSDDTYTPNSASFSKSGFVEFDEPLDWTAVSFNDIMGLQSGHAGWNTPETSGATPITPTTNPYEWSFTGTCTSVTLGGASGKVVSFTGAIPTDISGAASNIGAYKYLAILQSGSAGAAASVYGQGYWVASGTADGYDGTQTLYLQVGEGAYNGSGFSVYGEFSTSATYVFKIRRVNFYDVLDGASKVWNSTGTGAAAGSWVINNVDATDANGWPNRYGFMSGSNAGAALNTAWGPDSDLYALKLVLKGNKYASGSTAAATGNAAGHPGVELWNILPYDNAASQYIEEIDDTAYSLEKLPITSDVSISRKGTYYQAITRKGKVFIAKTGVGITKINFDSVAMGDEDNMVSNKFDSNGPGTTYGYLRKIRKLQEEGVRVFWDEEQKDGTFVRFWGIITSVAETRGTGGPRAIMNYSFSMTVEEIAIYDGNNTLITDIFPLGGVEDVRSYT